MEYIEWANKKGLTIWLTKAEKVELVSLLTTGTCSPSFLIEIIEAIAY